MLLEKEDLDYKANKYDETPFSLCCYTNNNELAKLLLAKKNLIINDSYEEYCILVKYSQTHRIYISENKINEYQKTWVDEIKYFYF